MGLADKGLISGSSSEGLDSTPQPGQHGLLRQMRGTAVRVEAARKDGRDAESKRESGNGDWEKRVSERERC